MSISARAVNVSIKFFGIVAVVSSLSSCQNSDYFESFRRDDERFQLAEQPVYAYSTKPQESATPAMSNPNFKMMPSRNFDLPKSDVISSDLNTLHPQLSRSDLNKPPVASKNHSGVKSELPKRAAPNIVNDRDVQYVLKELGLYKGPLDGKMGPKTHKAIMAFQKSRKLKADGVAGAQTKKQLAQALAEQNKKAFAKAK